jgi:EmrB/QacA subfamily drug resistance transporter
MAGFETVVPVRNMPKDQLPAGHYASSSLSIQEVVKNRNAVAFVVNLGAFLTPFMAASLNLGLPAMGRDLTIGAAGLSWVASSFLLAAAVCTVPFGRIADIYGRRRILLWGNVLYTLSSLMSALSVNAPMMLTSRVFQGVGGAMLFATGMAMLSSVFPPGERGRVLGNNVMAVYLGLACGPFVGGFLTQHFGWRSIFIVNFLLGILLVAVVLWKLRDERAPAQGESFDHLGAIVYGAALIALMIGFARLSTPSGPILLLAGLLGLAVFLFWEARIKSPILNIGLFRANPIFAYSNLAALIHYSATFAVTFVLSLFLQSVQGHSPQGAGFIMVAQPLMMAFFSPLAGRLSDRVEPRILASFGMCLTTLGVFLLAFLHVNTPVSLIVADLVLLGFGFAFFSSPNTNAVMSSLDKRHLGVGSGILGTMRVLGQNLSMGIVMMVVGIYLGTSAVGPVTHIDFLRSVRLIFFVFSGLGIVGLLASLARGRVRSLNQEDPSSRTADRDR